MNHADNGNQRLLFRRTTVRVLALAAGTTLLAATLQGQSADRRDATSKDAFDWLNEQNKASLIMLVEEGIITKALGTKIAGSLTQVR